MTSAIALGYVQVTLQFELSRQIDGAVSDTLSATNAATAYLPANLPYPRSSARSIRLTPRSVLNGIFYVLWTGCQSKALPRIYPIPYALETDWPVGAAGFEPLHLEIGSAELHPASTGSWHRSGAP